MSDIPWPDNYKKLFSHDGEYLESAHINWGSLEIQSAGYCLGYKLAADTLIKEALDSQDIHRLDTLVFPIIFLYRHYLELTLKNLIISLNSWNEEEIRQKFKKYNHDLTALWTDFKDLYREIVGEKIDEPFRVVEKYITDFVELDNASFSFRYPFTKQLKLIFREERRVNLRHFSERMDEISNFLLGTGDYMFDLGK